MVSSSSSRVRPASAALVVVALLLSLLAVVGAPPAGASTPAEDERGFLRLMNLDRTAAGLAPVVSDSALAATSRTWSANMGVQDRLYHDPALAVAASSVDSGWASAGENVGVGYSVETLHRAFMASPGHRANIMSPKFNRAGIGVVWANGKLWVTVRFLQAAPIAGVTGLEAPPRVPPPPVPPQSMEPACPSATTPRGQFADVATSTHAQGIRCVSFWGVAQGKSATTFDPQGLVTRAQMASFLARMLELSGVALPASPADAFSDDAGNTHEGAINRLAAIGVVRGRSSGLFNPSAPVSRAEMATFLVRAHDKVAATDLSAGQDRFFDDDGNAHEPNINKVAQVGLASGTSLTQFQPASPVRRGQMATFIARTLGRFVARGDVEPR